MMAHLDAHLSAYLDGELAGEELARAEAHLASCAECRAELDGLRRVVRRAGSLDDRPPERDLWAGIARQIATPDSGDVIPFAPRTRRFAFTMPQLAAAAVALMAVSAGAVTLLQPRPLAIPVGTAPGPVAVTRIGNPGDATVASYDSVITDMEQLLATHRGRLDTATVRVVEESLREIDAAIRQARTALAKDPNNRYLNSHLQRSLDRKLGLLRTAATLPVES
jgi:negative regulator of sigma E activity